MNFVLVQDLALILVLAGIATVIFKWLRQPVILGYIVAGFLAGEGTDILPTVEDVTDVEIWAKIGVIFLLFGLGLEFSFKKLLGVGRNALIAAAVIIPAMILLGFVAGQLLGWSPADSFMTGCMICMSSTIIIIKALSDLGLRQRKFTQIILGVLIFEDLAGVVMMVLMSSFSEVSGAQTGVLLSILKLVFYLVLWLVCGIFFIPAILKKFRGMMNDETMLIVSVGLCFGMVSFAIKVGFSAEFGAFVMGSVLAETVEAERIEKLMSPLKDLFGAIFFISVGMMIRPEVLATYWLPIVVISVTVVVGQMIFGTIGTLLSGEKLEDAVQGGFCLVQVGEFAFIVANAGTESGLCSSFLYPVVVAVSVITIFVTPFMMKVAPLAFGVIQKKIPEKWLHTLDNRTTNEKNDETKSVWKSLLLSLTEILGVYGVVSTAIVVIASGYLFPALMELENTTLSVCLRVLLLIAIVLLLSPLLRAIMVKKNHSKEYRFLMAEGRLSLFAVMALTISRFVASAAFVYFTIHSAFPSLNSIISLIISLGLCYLFIKVRAVKYHSILIERRFFHNLNMREYEKQKEIEQKNIFKNSSLSKSLSIHDLHLSEFTVEANASCIGKTLIELNYRNVYNIQIVSIIRGKKRINIPEGREMLFPEDRLLVLGTDSDIKRLTDEFADKTEGFQENKSVSLEQIVIKEGSSLVGVTILDSGIKVKAKCLVVGLEKHGVSLISPSIKTKFEVGDILWVVGEKDGIDMIKQDNIREEVFDEKE